MVLLIVSSQLIFMPLAMSHSSTTRMQSHFNFPSRLVLTSLLMSFREWRRMVEFLETQGCAVMDQFGA